jgi:arylesterase/paraoxonase
LLSAFLYFLSYRSAVLWTFYANTPSRLSQIANIDYEIKFKEITRNCEDVVLDEENSVAILSCDPGRDKWNTVMVSKSDFSYTLYCLF